MFKQKEKHEQIFGAQEMQSIFWEQQTLYTFEFSMHIQSPTSSFYFNISNLV